MHGKDGEKVIEKFQSSVKKLIVKSTIKLCPIDNIFRARRARKEIQDQRVIKAIQEHLVNATYR